MCSCRNSEAAPTQSPPVTQASLTFRPHPPPHALHHYTRSIQPQGLLFYFPYAFPVLSQATPPAPISNSHSPSKTQLSHPHLRGAFLTVPKHRNVQALSLLLNSWPTSPSPGCCWGSIYLHFFFRSLDSHHSMDIHTLQANLLPKAQSPDVSSFQV